MFVISLVSIFGKLPYPCKVCYVAQFIYYFDTYDKTPSRLFLNAGGSLWTLRAWPARAQKRAGKDGGQFSNERLYHILNKRVVLTKHRGVRNLLIASPRMMKGQQRGQQRQSHKYIQHGKCKAGLPSSAEGDCCKELGGGRMALELYSWRGEDFGWMRSPPEGWVVKVPSPPPVKAEEFVVGLV